jgi:acetoin:2,6-dichlorophenolindophenol oxidoreductase subunit alpha
VDGNDLLAVYESARRAVEECRTGLGPVLLELLTNRLTGHSRRDPCHYQPKEERAAWSTNDPIVRYAQKLLAGGKIVQSDLDKIREEINHEIDSRGRAGKMRFAPRCSRIC